MGTFRVSQWAPANETESNLFGERLLLNGPIIGAVAYGVHATLYIYCLSLFWSLRKREPRKSWIFGAYITINFILGSIGNGVNTVETQYAFIDDRDFPGGPLAYSFATSSITVNVVGFVAYVVNAWFQDGLLLYRFFIIFDHNYWIALIPAGLYIVSISQVQSIAPLIILLRVAQQRAWTRDTLKLKETHVDFVTITHQLTTQIDSSETRHGPLTTASKVNLPNSSFSDSVSEKV
ncbi:hypothetical protein Clacol_005260 [Clathrus columnatus]|uniref:Uncharacterized protein n=1 Tax=Clathrus columnatus TaxID=1419009 RepID=A0AAV5ACW6_9AGAM|nr:hypothetical protein Clacol_005260 [Clathrus columnatus]